MELSKEKEPCTSSSRNLARSDSCKKHKNFSRQAFSFLEVNLRRLRRNTWEGKYDTRENNLSAVLANSSNHSRARRHNITIYASKQHVHGKRHILSLKSKFLET